MGSIYLFNGEGTDLFKLGWSEDVNSRRVALQTGCPYKLVTVFEIKGCTQAHEASFHKLFEHKQVQGEWFRLDIQDISFIHGYKYGAIDRSTYAIHQIFKELTETGTDLISLTNKDPEILGFLMEGVQSLKDYIDKEFHREDV